MKAKKNSNIPMRELVSDRGNSYELTNAIVRRAGQIAQVGDDDLERCDNKVVSTAIAQILNKKVEFKYTR